MTDNLSAKKVAVFWISSSRIAGLGITGEEPQYLDKKAILFMRKSPAD